MKYRPKWKNIQSTTNNCWDRWTKEYLPPLVDQKKSTIKCRNLEI